ncbi:MAG: ComEC/Rec2 family competence protein [Candidatus Paceibacterota bacterium]|jgi:competence protein ComEC
MKRGIFIFWSIFIAAAVFRVWQSFDIEPPSVDSCVKQVVNGIGVVNSEPERKETGQVLVVSVESLSIASTSKSCGANFLIRMKTKLYPKFIFNDRISFTGKLLQPINFDSSDGRSFNYKGYLAKNDIYFEMKSATVGILDPNLSAGGQKSNINYWLYFLKRKFVNSLEKTLGEPHAALASGLVVGEKAALGKDLLNDFRTVGLIHIVVLSGYNITIVGDAMRRILLFLPRIWGIAIGGLGIAAFGIMVGGGATVIRSCFMAGVALSADLIRRDYNVTRALIFAGLIMLIQNPMILFYDPSFQLSFLATLGLIVLASPVEKYLIFIPEKFGIRGIVAATIATQIFVSPYILYTMGQLSIIGVVVNILVLPFIPVTMFFVFITGLIGMVYLPFAQVFGWITHFLLSYELFMVQKFAQLPFAAVNIPVFSGWWVVGFYILFAILFFTRKFSSTTRQLRFTKKSSI